MKKFLLPFKERWTPLKNLLLSLIIYRIEKVLFSGRFFEIEFSLDLHVLRSPESENHVFSGWSLCVCVCLCVNTITQERKVVECSNLVCRLYTIGACYPKLFIQISPLEGGVWGVVPKIIWKIFFDIVTISVILVNFIEFMCL